MKMKSILIALCLITAFALPQKSEAAVGLAVGSPVTAVVGGVMTGVGIGLNGVACLIGATASNGEYGAGGCILLVGAMNYFSGWTPAILTFAGVLVLDDAVNESEDLANLSAEEKEALSDHLPVIQYAISKSWKESTESLKSESLTEEDHISLAKRWQENKAVLSMQLSDDGLNLAFTAADKLLLKSGQKIEADLARFSH